MATNVHLTANNTGLVVSKPVFTDEMDVISINVTEDIYVNRHIYMPVGSVVSFAGSSAPSGWLLCDGSEVLKSDYPRLYNVVGTTYGTPVDSNKFTLPNLADRIPVGKSGSTTVGNTGGASSVTLTTSNLPAHTHTGTVNSNGAHTHTGTVDSNGAHTHGVSDPGHNHTVQDAYYAENQGPGAGWAGSRTGVDFDNDLYVRNIYSGSNTTGISINSAGSHTHTFTSDSNGAHTHTFTTDSTGSGNSVDIRNKFIVLNYIIRY